MEQTSTEKQISPSGQKSVSEIKQLDMEFKRRQEVFKAAQNALQFLDLTKTQTRTFNTFSREKFRQYMKNPLSNEKNIRNLSQFLYRLSHPYRRLINFNAEMVDLSAMTMIPNVDLQKKNNEDKILKNYYSTLSKVNKMDLKAEIYKCLVIAWREDTFFGFTYYDENEGLYIMPLDGNYCKISSTNFDGTFNFAYDMSYFSNHKELLDYWDTDFKKLYNKYVADPKQRWSELPPEKSICIKVNSEDPTMSIPPYIALFEQMMDLIDLQSIQTVRDELSAYMLLVAELETRNGATTEDEFKVDIETAIAYFNKLSESLPSCVNAALSPVKITPITFKGNTTEDTDMLSRSMENIFAMSGGYQVLGSTDSGASIFNAQILSDTLNAVKPVLPQIEHWHNRFLTANMGEHSKVKYLMCSQYTKESYKKSLLESAQYGVPVKMTVAALDGFDPLETLSMQFLENDCLKLSESWQPLQSSYTQSGSTSTNGTDPVKGGAPKKDAKDLTDSGNDTREEDKNSM